MPSGAESYSPSPEVRQAAATNVGRLFAVTAARHHDRSALISEHERLSFGELNARVNRLAHAMAASGLARGDRVALLARNCIPFLEVELAAAKIGVITVSLNWRSSPGELGHCLALTKPGLIVAAPEYEAALDQAAAAIPRLVIGSSYETALASADDSEPEARVDGEDGLVIIFTSGTTGLPKGALISHRAMIARSMIYAAELSAPKEDTFVAWTPLFHMGANDFSLATLLRGGQVIVIDGYRPEQLIAAVEQYPIHYLPLVPGMIAEFIAALKSAGAKPKGIALIGAMADLVPRPLLAEITSLLDAPYLNTFGSTETGIPPATSNVVAIASAPETLSKNQNNFCEIRLVDADDNDVADGEPGELAIRGPSLFSGYWANEEANAEAFRNGWFHIGDVFRRNSDGSLDFVDRVKYMIKSGGENIYPAEIEQHILADPRIAEAVVVRKADERWGEVPVVFAARNDEALSGGDVIDMCRGRIAGYKLPKEVHFLAFDDFPRSTTGKILRHELEATLRD